MIENLCFNIRGRKDLTEQCFITMRDKVDWGKVRIFILDGSLPEENPITSRDIGQWIPPIVPVMLHNAPGYGMSQGWNTLFADIKNYVDNLGESRYDNHFHQMNNDMIFKKSGWLEKLSEDLILPGVGETGTGRMQVFGHEFVTGAVASLNLGVLCDLFPNNDFMHPKLNYAYADVALSIEIRKAGYKLSRAMGIEWGEDPYIVHLISQTVYSREGQDRVMQYRSKEGKIFVDLYGRFDGKRRYEGI